MKHHQRSSPATELHSIVCLTEIILVVVTTITGDSEIV